MNDIFKALADPGRRKIIRLLKKSPMNVGEILRHFEMSGASLNHHLNILKNAGLVDREKQGQFIVYSLNTTILQEALEWIYEIRGATDKTAQPPKPGAKKKPAGRRSTPAGRKPEGDNHEK